ncbi:flagellar brake protein [Desulforamulus ferrireducens]|uniref:flagellar brake protein n=1 Tax=Desulforamulus ferrireducens TaxID=1833852 RepID=UPI001EE4760C|nr:flagellar brake domain-containing protein [Desulforamulus ferrireducens]
MAEKLKIGQRLTIFPMHSEEQFISSVYDMDGKGIYVPIPYNNNHPLVLSHGEKVRIKYMGEGSVYLFVTEAIGRKAEQDKLPLYVFKHPRPEDITRIQMREFARVPVLMDIFFAPPPAKNEEPVFQKAYSVDLSGGGIKIALKEPVKTGTILLVKFDLYIRAKKRQEEFRLLAKTVRCQLADDEAKVYHASLQFLDIRPAQQDLLMAFVFERMVEIKRRQ